MSLESIRYINGKLEVLDQLLLPIKHKYIEIKDVQDGWNVINKMQVRGAPAIAIVGCLSLAVEIAQEKFESKEHMRRDVQGKLNFLTSARPTAVNPKYYQSDLQIKIAADEIIDLATKMSVNQSCSIEDMRQAILDSCEAMLRKDISDNKLIGSNGANEIMDGLEGNARILTHCNTGSLATAGYGTALGVVRKLKEKNRLDHVYFTETRPYNQGARLTAYELVHDNIPATLILDSMVAALFQKKNITAVVVGADRVVANGDTANKIGTYQIAVVARFHHVPFYIAAPLTSIDLKIQNGDQISIEERPEREMTYIGDHQIAAPNIKCWNPAFDVTPANLITGIITEVGVLRPDEIRKRVTECSSASIGVVN